MPKKKAVALEGGINGVEVSGPIPEGSYFAEWMRLAKEAGMVSTDRRGVIIGQIQSRGKAVGMEAFRAIVKAYLENPFYPFKSADNLLRHFDSIANKVAGSIIGAERDRQREIERRLSRGGVR